MATDSTETTDMVEVVERGFDVDGSQWALIVADILAPGLFDDDGAISAEAHRVIAGYMRCVPLGHVGRARLIIGDVHVLALVLPETRTCRLYTPGAAQETFLLTLSDDATLQAHVDAFTQSPPTFTTIDQVTATYRLVDLPSPSTPVAGHDRASWETEVYQQVETLVRLIETYRPSPVERLQDWFLQVTTEHTPLLHQVLRFVAVLPSLRFDRSRHEMVRALRENVGLLLRTLTTELKHHGRRDRLLALVARLIALAARTLPPRMVGALVNRAVALIATRFIVPDTPVELSALSTHFNPIAPQATAEEMRQRLGRILRHAKRRGTFICFDAEHYAYRDLSAHVPALVLAATPELVDFHDFGFVVQAYVQDAVSFLEYITALARQRGHRIQVRLVKGAYWDAETTEAAAEDVPAPTFWNKAETDIHFQQLVLCILERSDALALAVGSHNVREHAFAETARAHLYPHAPVIEHQVLHHTAEGLARALARDGWATRDYVPVGDLLPGIAYLVRRILENASQVGILAQSREQLSAEIIATDPAHSLSELVAQGAYAWDPAVQATHGEFRPSSPVRLHVPAEREAFAAVLASTEVHSPLFVTPADVPQ